MELDWIRWNCDGVGIDGGRMDLFLRSLGVLCGFYLFNP